MPYRQLPPRLKQLIPSAQGQRIFMDRFNRQMQSGKSESVAFASAWATLEVAGYKRDPKTGIWGKLQKASGAKPLYMRRKVLNAEKIIEWAKSHGVPTTLGGDDMHVTVLCSKEAFSPEYTRLAEERGEAPMHYGTHVVRGGKRSVERLGDGGQALVLKIECPRLASEHYAFRSMGASSDWPDYKPHITISWGADGVDESKIAPFEGDIVLSDIFVSLLDEDRKSKITEKSADTYRPPAGARAAAARAIRWKEKHGDQVKGGTQVGWTRAGQLARGENLSRETVARMASFFARHRGNEKVDPKYKDEPWRDNGHVAWLIWGGDAADTWSRGVMDRLEKRQIDDDQFTQHQEAAQRSYDLGLDGDVHVHDVDGQAVYMPGKTHEAYLNQMRAIADLDQEYDDDSGDDENNVKEGLLERTVSAIIATIMQHSLVNKSAEQAQVLKMDDEQRIVYGWAYVSTEDGKLLVDTQGDSVEPIEMEKMATRFMVKSRRAKVMHKGDVVGQFVHSLPLTNDLMKAFGIHSDREGWIVGMRPETEELWQAYKSGKYTGFSIGGKAGDVEEYDAA